MKGKALSGKKQNLAIEFLAGEFSNLQYLMKHLVLYDRHTVVLFEELCH